MTLTYRMNGTDPTKLCPHDFEWAPSFEKGVSTQRCKNCGHEIVSHDEHEGG